MSFRDDNPNWKIYLTSSEKMTTVPQSAFPELCGVIRKAATNANQLKKILNRLAEIIPCALTQDWGLSFLENDIKDFVNEIETKVKKGKFPIFMDCLAALIEVGNLSPKDINEYLEDNNIGYRAECSFDHCVNWHPLEENSTIEQLEDVQTAILSVSQQACDEIRRAKKSLEDTDDERAIKDSLRSCVSAMEAVVKELGHDDEIGNATRNLRSEKVWGNDEIVKEGNSIFNTMHRLYPDLRHGSTESSSLTLNEAEYWIGRILNYLQYIDRQQDIINKKTTVFTF